MPDRLHLLPYLQIHDLPQLSLCCGPHADVRDPQQGGSCLEEIGPELETTVATTATVGFSPLFPQPHGHNRCNDVTRAPHREEHADVRQKRASLTAFGRD